MIRLNKILNQQKLLLLSLSAIGIVAVPSQVSAFTLVNRDNLTDTQFNNLLITKEYTETFVAESRMGNNSLGTAERELGINSPLLVNAVGELKGGNPVASGQRTWTSGTPVNFILEYNGSKVTYTVGGELLSSTAFTSAATDIFLRTFSKGNTNSTSTLTNLFLNGQAVGKNLSSAGTSTSDDADYIQISGITTPFKLTGQSIFSWTGAAPQRSQLAYQIKVASKSVPEPGMIAGIFVAGAIGVVNAKRKKQSVSH